MTDHPAEGVAPAELEPLATSLDLGGYRMTSTIRDGSVDVVVAPGPEACVECLVPATMFRTMVEDMLRDTGLRVERIDYPKEAPVVP